MTQAIKLKKKRENTTIRTGWVSGLWISVGGRDTDIHIHVSIWILIEYLKKEKKEGIDQSYGFSWRYMMNVTHMKRVASITRSGVHRHLVLVLVLLKLLPLPVLSIRTTSSKHGSRRALPSEQPDLSNKSEERHCSNPQSQDP